MVLILQRIQEITLKPGDMDISPFTVYYVQHDVMHSAEIRPCCREDNVVDYAVWENDQLAFTIAQQAGSGKWVVALKNADDDIDEELVELIGAEIGKKRAHKNE